MSHRGQLHLKTITRTRPVSPKPRIQHLLCRCLERRLFWRLTALFQTPLLLNMKSKLALMMMITKMMTMTKLQLLPRQLRSQDERKWVWRWRSSWSWQADVLLRKWYYAEMATWNKSLLGLKCWDDKIEWNTFGAKLSHCCCAATGKLSHNSRINHRHPHPRHHCCH